MHAAFAPNPATRQTTRGTLQSGVTRRPVAGPTLAKNQKRSPFPSAGYCPLRNPLLQPPAHPPPTRGNQKPSPPTRSAKTPAYSPVALTTTCASGSPPLRFPPATHSAPRRSRRSVQAHVNHQPVALRPAPASRPRARPCDLLMAVRKVPLKPSRHGDGRPITEPAIPRHPRAPKPAPAPAATRRPSSPRGPNRKDRHPEPHSNPRWPVHQHALVLGWAPELLAAPLPTNGLTTCG